MIDETVSDVPTPTPKKKSNTGKIIGIGCGGLIALLLVVTIIRAIVDPEGFKQSLETSGNGDTEQKTNQTQGTTKVPEVVAPQGAAKWPAKGIGVSRDRIAREWGKLAPGFRFVTSSPVDGQENVYGDFPNFTGTGVQIIGPADDPFIIVFSVDKQTGLNDEGRNATTIPELRRKFAQIMGPECEKWVSKEIGGDWPKEGVGDGFAELESGNRQYQLRYHPTMVELRIEAFDPKKE